MPGGGPRRKRDSLAGGMGLDAARTRRVEAGGDGKPHGQHWLPEKRGSWPKPGGMAGGAADRSQAEAEAGAS